MGATTRNVPGLPIPEMLDAEIPGSDHAPPRIASIDATPLDTRVRENLGQDRDRAEILEFLDKLDHLQQEGSNHLAIDAILAFFDDALREGNLARCQETLREIDPGKLSASMMKTVLVITGKAKAWLPEREVFFDRSMDAVTAARGRQDAERLLSKHA